MTDRYHSLTVVLERDIREDDARALIAAILQLRNVISVSGNVADVGSHISDVRARRELGESLMRVLYPKA